jgi:hypothetical protein
MILPGSRVSALSRDTNTVFDQGPVASTGNYLPSCYDSRHLCLNLCPNMWRCLAKPLTDLPTHREVIRCSQRFASTAAVSTHDLL